MWIKKKFILELMRFLQGSVNIYYHWINDDDNDGDKDDEY